MPALGFIAALHREIAPLVRGWRCHAVDGHVMIWSRGRTVVACAGMGSGRAAVAVQAAMSLGAVDVLVSVGLAGACDPGLRPGTVVPCGQVLDAQTGERFGDPSNGATLVTAATLAGVTEKGRFFAAYGAGLVDMEAATVARLARAHNLRFRAVKAISDGADFEVEALARFSTSKGQFRERAFAAHAALRPALWGRLLALSKNSRAALKGLTLELQRQIDLFEGLHG